jgi:hypothetical protein
MVPLSSLWLPILVSAVAVFLLSSVLHMVLRYHKSDYRKAASEDALLDSLRGYNLAPGDYMVPCAGGPEAMRSPEFKEKWKRGPVVVMTVIPGGVGMGGRLVQWFVYLIVIGIFAGYVAGRALAPGAPLAQVFRFVGTVAFIGYGVALWQDSIWYSRSWATTARLTFDSLLYGILTGAIFGGMWPKV